MVLNKHYYYDEIFRDIRELSQTYTEFTTSRIVGTSHDERDIPMIRIGLGMNALGADSRASWEGISESGTSYETGRRILSGLCG